MSDKPEVPTDDFDDEMFAQMSQGNIPIGYHPQTGDICYLHNADRYSGTIIAGAPGSGKSRLMIGMMCNEAALNHSFGALDPHGDLVDDTVAALHDNNIHRVSVFDLLDESHPFGVNPLAVRQFATSAALSQHVNSVWSIFMSHWPELSGQQHARRYLQAAIITLLASPSNLVDMHRLFTDNNFRASKLRALADPSVLQFWQTQYEDLAPAARLQRIEPLLGRLESLFMGRSLVRNVLGQENTIDFRRAIMNSEILLFKLGVNTLGQDAYLIGNMIISQVHAAVFSFANLLPANRPSFSFYIDEARHFAGLPELASMLTDGRKYCIRLALAFQHRSQLPASLQEPTMNARTKICFQSTPDDARELASLFIGGTHV